MPLDFVNNVEQGIGRLDSSDWLTPATVHGLTDADFVTLPRAQREELFRRADQFRLIAEAAPNMDAAQTADARAALAAIWEILRPYRVPPESKTIREVLWRAWEDEQARSWIPTFDYYLGNDWSGDPAVWVWFILEDGVDRSAAAPREVLRRLTSLIHARLQEVGIDRWPYPEVRNRSEVSGLAAKVPA